MSDIFLLFHPHRACDSAELTLFLRGSLFIFWALRVRVSWLNPMLKDAISDGDGWIKSDGEAEYKPSPPCSRCPKGPGGPGSWAGPGTGTGSEQGERNCLQNELGLFFTDLRRFSDAFLMQFQQ